MAARDPDIDRRLRADSPARVADFACGLGWSSIAIARAYPLVTGEGFDLDAAAIASAVDTAAAEGLADRVSFTVADATDPGLSGRFDLVTILEGFHDMARPVEALRAVRAILADGGSVLIIDERVADAFAAPADDLERYHYACSVVGCLPGAMGHPQTAATGASCGSAHYGVTRRRPASGRSRSADRYARVAVLPPAPLTWPAQFFDEGWRLVHTDPNALHSATSGARHRHAIATPPRRSPRLHNRHSHRSRPAHQHANASNLQGHMGTRPRRNGATDWLRRFRHACPRRWGCQYRQYPPHPSRAGAAPGKPPKCVRF